MMIILEGAIETPDVTIDHEACDLCANCVRTCPMGVLKIVHRRVVQTEAICIGCRNCKVSCRPRAIEVTGQHRPLKHNPPIGYFPIPATPPYRGIHPNKVQGGDHLSISLEGRAPSRPVRPRRSVALPRLKLRP